MLKAYGQPLWPAIFPFNPQKVVQMNHKKYVRDFCKTSEPHHLVDYCTFLNE